MQLESLSCEVIRKWSLNIVVNFYNYFSSQVHPLGVWKYLSSLLAKFADSHPLGWPGNEEKFKYLFISVKFMSPMFGAINITFYVFIVC